MNILILNWRDIKNPKSGGAEILTHEIAKRWVRLGNRVTLFSSSFPSLKKEQIVDGVKIIREGHPDARFLFSSVHFMAFKYYRKNIGKFDVVIDEIHGFPFFTPWYVKEKKVVLICEVAGDLWKKMFGPFFGSLGRAIEKFYLRFIYKNILYLTISNSTKEELVREGVRSRDITVLPMGLTIPGKIKKTEKEKDITLIYVGRLSKSKGIEDAVAALKILSRKYPKTKLWIVGSGEEIYVKFLKEKSRKLNVADRIIFWGFVSEDKKFELMSKAHILIAPSAKEGWGLTVPEAGAVGTPAVGYNVAGLQDVIKNGVSGYLTSKNTPNDLAINVENAVKKKSDYLNLSKEAKRLSVIYNWDNTAKVALGRIK